MMKKAFLLMCFAIVANMLTGQSIKRYEGLMRFPSDLEQLKDVVKIYGIGDGGNGYYDYYVDSEENRVKHGKFYLNVNGYDINGSYSHGKKVGQWTFVHPSEKTYIKTYYNNLKITYKDDILCGPCEYITRASNGWPATVTVSCNFNDGILIGDASVLYEFDSYSITSDCRGKIDNNGLLHGIWTISNKGGIEITQKRIYYKGSLVYVEEQDFSTGEKTICYTAFEDLKKAPSLETIRDTIVNGQDGIVYNGQIAIKTSSYEYKNPSHAKCSVLSIIDDFPDSMEYSELLSQQRESWTKAYSQYEYESAVKAQRLKRQKQKEDSIRNANNLHLREKEKAYHAFVNYLAEIRNNHIKVIENYNGSYTTVYVR